MPSFAQNLEKTLHNALSHASERRHEYATLEHLLLALIDDEDGAAVMTACGVDLAELGEVVKQQLLLTHRRRCRPIVQVDAVCEGRLPLKEVPWFVEVEVRA